MNFGKDYFDAYGDYDKVTADIAAEYAPFILKELGCQTVLILGSGKGPLVKALLDAGADFFDVLAVESSTWAYENSTPLVRRRTLHLDARNCGHNVYSWLAEFHSPGKVDFIQLATPQYLRPKEAVSQIMFASRLKPDFIGHDVYYAGDDRDGAEGDDEHRTITQRKEVWDAIFWFAGYEPVPEHGRHLYRRIG